MRADSRGGRPEGDGVHKAARGVGGNRSPQPRENSEIRSRPTGRRGGGLFRAEIEVRGAHQSQIRFGRPLDPHGVPKQGPNEQRAGEGATGLGQQERSAGLEHSEELKQSAFLVAQVMQGLVAEHHVHGRVGDIELGDVSGANLELAGAADLHGLEPSDQVRIHVDADQHLRMKPLLEQRKGQTVTTTGVENRLEASPVRSQ